VYVDIKAGSCYTIRIGGFGTAYGTGNLSISLFDGSCRNTKHDCFTTGGPGCSDESCCSKVCKIDPFCCDTAWDGICVNEAFLYCGAPCVGCFDCPPESPVEAEPCGSDTNGGCDAQPAAYEQLACGSSVCGTQWTATTDRDTDWYVFETDGGPVTWSVYANMPTTTRIQSNTCPPTVLAVGTGFFPIVASAAIPAGTYVAFISPGVFADLPCGGGENNDYLAYLECAPPCPSDANDDNEIDIDDLLIVINAWGSCLSGDVVPPVPSCDSPCPKFAVQENEPCGEDFNSGCNAINGCVGASGNCCYASMGWAARTLCARTPSALLMPSAVLLPGTASAPTPRATMM
jgi:hypothetical protein